MVSIDEHGAPNPYVDVGERNNNSQGHKQMQARPQIEFGTESLGRNNPSNSTKQTRASKHNHTLVEISIACVIYITPLTWLEERNIALACWLNWAVVGSHIVECCRVLHNGAQLL